MMGTVIELLKKDMAFTTLQLNRTICHQDKVSLH